MRTMLTDPVWKLVSKAYGEFGEKRELVVFPKNAFGPFPAKAKLVAIRCGSGWRFVRKGLPLFPSKVFELAESDTTIAVQAGFLLNKLVVSGETEGQLIFSRRYSGQLDSVAQEMGFQPPQQELPATETAIA